MAFEIADGDFGGIPTMATRRNEFNREVVLGADVLFLNELLKMTTVKYL